MPRLATALVLGLAAVAANAQDVRSGPPDTSPAAGSNGARPFLYDARMPGDGLRQRALTDDRHPSAGAIVVAPKASEPGRE